MPEGPSPRRDLVRPVLAAGTCFLLLQVAVFFLVPVLQFVGGPMVAITLSILISAVVSSALAMAMFEGRSILDLGLDWREGVTANVIRGCLLGCAGALAAVLPSVALGAAHFQAQSGADFSIRRSVFLFVLLFCGAAGEEIVFRGFVLQTLVRGYGWIFALAASAAVFGWLHKDNPSASWLSVVNTALFGILFGFAVWRAHDLWLPIGLHFGWNATLPFLGVELSGLTIKVAGYELVWNSSDLWSGGQYGPEAGLTSTVVLVLLFAAVWKMPVARNRAYLLEPASPA